MAFVYLIIAAAAISAAAWFLWPDIKHWFADSETIFWARLQTGLGAIWTAMQQADISSIFSNLGYAKYAGIALLVMGVVTELMRKSRTVGGGDLTPKA